MDSTLKIFGFLIWMTSLMLFSGGCDTYIVNNDPYYRDCDGCWCDNTPPQIPYSVHSITGDNSVYLYWNPITSWDMAGYAIYRGSSPTGYYDYIGTSYCASFTDISVLNGETYYYAIASYDNCGNESELSTDLIYDTPRPEGHSWYLWASESYYYDGGYDFSEGNIIEWDHPTCDVFFGHDSLGYYLCAANDYTDILDYGPASSLSDVDIAPETGWSSIADLTAVEGHIYVLWTADNHFAALLIRDISGECMTFDWSYQIDTGNPELRPSRSVVERRKNRQIKRGLRLTLEGE
ncbi:hypothetical protein KAH81_03690 [bacterium]|nr:hypothetical protein [bacterium]